MLVGEENGTNGRVFEILDPLNTTGVIITGRGRGDDDLRPGARRPARCAGSVLVRGSRAAAERRAVHDATRTGPGNGNPGGAIVKFIPSNPWRAAPPITDLAQSPLAAGTLWGMRLGRNSGNTDFGQGNEFGRGVWVAGADEQR